MERNLLLISNSTLFGSGYLDHCELAIKDILGETERDNPHMRYGDDVLFIPYARPNGMTYDEYTAKARERFEKMDFSLRGIHEQDNPTKAVEKAKAIFIGGGNTFVLLNSLYENRIMGVIRKKVVFGVPYIGTSAGANVAGRTIMTTNDMPIVYLTSFNSMNLVPFNINPHYLDTDRNSRYMSESRETRIKEYHVFNEDIVVGLREGAMLRIIGNNVILRGTNGAKIFRKDEESTEHTTGESLDFLLD